MAIIDIIRQRIARQEYELALPHFLEEMVEDDLIFADIEMAIEHGRIRRKFARDPRGIRYEVVGPTTDGRQAAIICRVKTTGKILLITTYALEDMP